MWLLVTRNESLKLCKLYLKTKWNELVYGRQHTIRHMVNPSFWRNQLHLCIAKIKRSGEISSNWLKCEKVEEFVFWPKLILHPNRLINKNKYDYHQSTWSMWAMVPLQWYCCDMLLTHISPSMSWWTFEN
jgi:hypothetical protein